jgi:hypothetical protein
MNKAKENNKFKKLKETKLSDVVKSIEGVPVDLFTMLSKKYNPCKENGGVK